MILKHLEIKNFIVFEDVSLSLGEEAFFITGQNNDKMSSTSNGAGKSTLCQAIVWCLFDDILRKGMLKDGVIGPFEEWCQVRLTVEKDDREIVIDRARNHPTRGHDIKIFIDGEDKSLHSASDTNTYIERLLGVTSNIVYYCAYTDSTKEPLVSLTSASLHKVVCEILDVQRFDDYLKEIKTFRKNVESQHSSLLQTVASDEKSLQECEKDITFLNSEIASFESTQRQAVSKLEQQAAECAAEIADYETMLEKKESVEKTYRELLLEIKELEKFNGLLKQVKARRPSHEDAVAKCNKRFHMAQAELEKAEEAYDNIFNNISGLCQFCGHDLAGAKHLDTYAAQISNRRDNAKADLIDAEIDLKEKQKEFQAYLEEVEGMEKQLEANQDKLNNFNKLKSKMEAFEKVKAGLDYCQKLQRQLKDQLRVAKSTSAMTLKSNLRSKETLRSELRTSILANIEQIALKEKEAKACSSLELAIKSTKTALFNNFILEFQDRINENLESMTSGEYHCAFHDKNGELAMVFTDSSKNGKYLPFSVFSTGERARISKAASMALNEMLSVGFMIDDEGLEGLDAEGSVSVLDFILSRSNGKTLFFVSHSSVVNDHLTTGMNIHVTKESGRSVIELKRNS
jgi:DNA repair exonuclease SbcCD ATPase subunit